MHQAALAGALGRGPAGIEPVGGRGQEPDVAAILRHHPTAWIASGATAPV